MANRAQWQYVSKRVQIEACQWTGNKRDMMHFLGDDRNGKVVPGRDNTLEVMTLEGTMIASPGDYIIRGLKGEFYPCKPDIFAMKYESVAGMEER